MKEFPSNSGNGSWCYVMPERTDCTRYRLPCFSERFSVTPFQIQLDYKIISLLLLLSPMKKGLLQLSSERVDFYIESNHAP
jgi:hypothetical protein